MPILVKLRGRWSYFYFMLRSYLLWFHIYAASFCVDLLKVFSFTIFMEVWTHFQPHKELQTQLRGEVRGPYL